MGRPEPDIIQIPKRSESSPVECSLRNTIIARTEENLLDRAIKNLAELRRNGWQFLPFSPPLSKLDRLTLETYVSQLKLRVEARKLHEQEIEREKSLWNVTEEVGEIDPRVYGIMKKLTIWVTRNDADCNDEVEGEKDEGETNYLTNDSIIKWNPITMIQKYRHISDPLRYLHFPMDFYAKVLAKYGGIHIKILSKNDKEALRKACDIVNKYKRQFYDRNYRYTWYEWFWIVRYAQAISSRRAAKMLLALDGKEGTSRDRISPKHIKDKINTVIKFWQDFFCYTPYFFIFLKFIRRLIKRDPELKAEYNNILEWNHKEDDTTINKMLEEHLTALQEKMLEDSNNLNNNIDYYLGTNNDDFKPVKIRPERIRVHHSNKNYQKEMEEFKYGSRKEMPRKKISCTFSPSLLPVDVRIKLHKEGKVPIRQTLVGQQ